MKVALISLAEINPGIRILSSCLKKEGYDVRIIFFPDSFKHKYDDTMLNQVLGLLCSADLIGVSVQTQYFDSAVRITQAIKEKLSISVLWGGIHPTILPEECLEYADMVCLGEGELALVELVDKMTTKEKILDVQNIWFKENSGIIKNKLRPLICDLDSVPFPDYDCENHYIVLDGQVKKIERDMIPLYSWYCIHSYILIGSRGCPFGCTFCCNNFLNTLYAGQ